MNAPRLLLILIAAAATGGTILAQGTATAPPKPATLARAKSALPLVEGEIRKLDAEAGLIVLKHGDVPNLAMPAMTMGYAVADRKMLGGFKVGDKVRFQAEMVGDKATVTELQRR